ncbi:recombination regulator RecX [Paraburkholderia sp. B3]|uniref:recombination regulator RecX n=1 Tax=Paraburkholderia sp. B3 TaxID=3134791 RepID=UPI003981EC60
MIRKGRSASAPPAPTEAGRPRDPRAPGGPHEPFEQVGAPGGPIDAQFGGPFGAAFDEFESSFGAFESADDAPQADRFERTSSARAARSAARGGEPAAPATPGTRFERTSESRKERAPAASQRPGPSLKGRALAYLSRREYSRAELSRKLMPYTDNADELEALLDSLVREAWLSDARFAESIIHRRAARLGATRIVGELKRHAVGDTLIEEVSAQLRETELVRARAVWQKKYGTLPETPAERARQARFLAARGFSMAIIGKILKGIEDDGFEN